MEALAYLLKVNIAIILLYGVYCLFFQRDTFFHCKRFFLLSIFFISILYPFWDISQFLAQSEAIVSNIHIPAFPLTDSEIIDEAPVLMGSAIPKNHTLPQLLLLGYSIIAFILLCYLFIQIFGIIFQIHKSRPSLLFGHQVYLLEGITTPFSFFGWIILDSEKHNASELNEILLHENTHKKQWHSIDTLFCEIMCALCWFNPFIWLMKREIRMNLEYLADRSVIHSGCDTEHYQFHLLRLSYHKAAAKLSNNFNVSPLKKRILMMNKKQTSWLGLTKYALFVPVVAALLLFNNLQAISNENPLSNMEPLASISELIPEISLPETAPEMASPKTKALPVEGHSTQKKDSALIFSHVEVTPKFPGGDQRLVEYLQTNLKYPADAAEKGICGRVVLRFIVNSTGKTKGVEILRSLDPSCDKEAIRVVEAMPNWIPGKQNGKDVSVWHVMPITFKLWDDTKDATPPTTDSSKKEEVVFIVDGKTLSASEATKSEKFINATEFKVEKGTTSDGKPLTKIIVVK